MKNIQPPEIVTLPVGNKFGKENEAVFIAYVPRTGNARLMTSDLLNELHKAAADAPDTSPEMRRAVADLRQMPADYPVPLVNDDPGKLRNLVIIPNFTCNFRCSYCYAAEGKENKYLPENKLLSALDFFLTPERANGRKLRLTFLGGGEPLLAASLIEKGCEYAAEKSRKLNIRTGYSLVTNGSLITPEVAGMIKKYQIQCAVSFEILEDVQNAQRDQYENVVKGIRTLISAGIIPVFRSIITDLNISRMTEMVQRAAADFPEVRELNFEIATMPEKFADHNSMLKMLGLFCTNFRSARREAQKTGIHLANSLFDCVQSLQERFCPGEFVLTPDGDITCCHRVTHPSEKYFDDFRYGSFNDNGTLRIDTPKGKQLLSQGINVFQTCQTCPARLNCGGFCLIKRLVYTPEAMTAVCETIRSLLTDHLFETIEKNTREMGFDVFEFFNSK